MAEIRVGSTAPLFEWTVLINLEGKVEYHWSKVKAEGHAEQVRVKLTELRRS